MHNRISKVDVIGDFQIRCSFYSGDVREYDVSTLDDCPKKEFDNIKIANNGDCIRWKNGFELLSEEIWEAGMLIERGYPESKYQIAMLMSYYRELCGMTQKEVERKTGITQSDVSKYERGEGNPSLDTINRIAEAFGRKVKIDFCIVPDGDSVDASEFSGSEEIISYIPGWKKQGQFTVKDIENIPEEHKVELINGVIRMMSQPSIRHQMAASFFNVEIGMFIKKNKGKCSVIQAPALIFDNKDISNTYLVPDVAMVCDKNNIGKNGIINFADLIIEIVSPGVKNRSHDYKTKMSIYVKAGVKEYWIVDIEKQRVTIIAEKDEYMPTIYGFDSKIPVRIYDGKLVIDMKDLDLEQIP